MSCASSLLYIERGGNFPGFNESMETLYMSCTASMSHFSVTGLYMKSMFQIKPAVKRGLVDYLSKLCCNQMCCLVLITFPFSSTQILIAVYKVTPLSVAQDLKVVG